MTASRIPSYWVDAFVAPGLRGNPAGVCWVERPLSDSQMQTIAAEVNLAETAFVTPRGSSGAYGLRWFTPEEEVPLCGHATLASAHVLFAERGLDAARIRFATRSGVLEAVRSGPGIRISLPREDPEPATLDPTLLRSLGVPAPVAVARGPRSKKHLVELAHARDVAELRPDLDAVRRAVTDRSVEGIVVTARGEAPTAFVSRFFHPWAGVPEDHVTGSSHALLAPYWAPRLGPGPWTARQLSRRGGELEVELTPDEVRLTGRCSVVARGEIDLNALP